MDIYRGYTITKAVRGYTFYGSEALYHLTEEEAMNEIDSLERERVKRDQANIQRVDNQVKR